MAGRQRERPKAGGTAGPRTGHAATIYSSLAFRSLSHSPLSPLFSCWEESQRAKQWRMVDFKAPHASPNIPAPGKADARAVRGARRMQWGSGSCVVSNTTAMVRRFSQPRGQR